MTFYTFGFVNGLYSPNIIQPQAVAATQFLGGRFSFFKPCGRRSLAVIVKEVSSLGRPSYKQLE